MAKYVITNREKVSYGYENLVWWEAENGWSYKIWNDRAVLDAVQKEDEVYTGELDGEIKTLFKVTIDSGGKKPVPTAENLGDLPPLPELCSIESQTSKLNKE